MQKEFGERLRKYGINKYGNLSNFAVELGISQSVLSQYLNGKMKPGFDFFEKLANDGCSIDELFGLRVKANNIKNIVWNNNDQNIEKIEGLFRELLASKDEKIKLLEELLNMNRRVEVDGKTDRD